MGRDANQTTGAKSRLAQALSAHLAKSHAEPLRTAMEFVDAMWDEGWRPQPALVIRREDRPTTRAPYSAPTDEFRRALEQLRERRNNDEPEEQE